MRKNIIGNKYNRLTVISESYRNKKRIWYNCLCECGNEKIVSIDNLKSGAVKSCGCLKKDNIKQLQQAMIGKRFGKLVIKDIVNLTGATEYLCQCDCGNITRSDGWSLKSGHKTSCGCVREEKRQQFIDNKKEDLINRRFGKLVAIKDSKKRDINGNIIWRCKCDCGGICYESSNILLQGRVESCGCLKSKGEEKITKIFISNKINFKKQYTFSDLKDKAKLRFDFGVLDNNENLLYLIEYDGSQHFNYSGNGWNNLVNYSKSKYRDGLKNNYCSQNNIPLIRIPYTHLGDICLDDLILGKTCFLYKEVSYNEYLFSNT